MFDLSPGSPGGAIRTQTEVFYGLYGLLETSGEEPGNTDSPSAQLSTQQALLHWSLCDGGQDETEKHGSSNPFIMTVVQDDKFPSRIPREDSSGKKLPI